MILVNQGRRRKWNERICDRTRKLTKCYGEQTVVKEVDLHVRKGGDLRAARKERGREDDIDEDDSRAYTGDLR